MTPRYLVTDQQPRYAIHSVKSNEPVEMICDAYRNGLSDKEQS